jgi:hypothetical protein
MFAMRIMVWSVLAVVLLSSACGGPEPEISGNVNKSGPPNTSNIEIHGDTSEPVNKLAVQAVADLQDYWGREFPELYGKDYEPVKGGFYAVIPVVLAHEWATRCRLDRTSPHAP